MPEQLARKSIVKVHKVLMQTKSNRNKYVIQLVSFDDGPLILEKRQLVFDVTTKKEVVGRQRGLIGQEVRELVKRWPEIEGVFLECCKAYNNRGNK